MPKLLEIEKIFQNPFCCQAMSAVVQQLYSVHYVINYIVPQALKKLFSTVLSTQKELEALVSGVGKFDVKCLMLKNIKLKKNRGENLF